MANFYQSIYSGSEVDAAIGEVPNKVAKTELMVNPIDTATDTLKKIKIYDTVYGVDDITYVEKTLPDTGFVNNEATIEFTLDEKATLNSDAKFNAIIKVGLDGGRYAFLYYCYNGFYASVPDIGGAYLVCDPNSNKLYIKYFVAPTNDSTATDGQVLTKTAEGSEWKNSKTNTTYRGNVITGTSTTATIFRNSGIENANVDDWYINIDNGNVYKCTVAGPASVAKWVYNNTQAILSNESYSEELHMGIGTWADDTTGLGAFLTQEVGGTGRLDLIGGLNYLNKIYPSNETSTFFLPDVETGTFAMTSDLPTVINKPYTGAPTFTTDEMSQIIKNFRNTIILLQYTGAFNGDYFLYPDSRQDSNTCVFVSQGSRSFAGPPGQGIIQLVITKAPDGTGTGTISLKAVVSTSDNNTFTGTNTFTGGFSVQRDSSNNINITDTQLSRLKGGINLTYTFPNESGVLMVRPNEDPTEDSVAVVSSTGTVSYKKLSELSGGGTSVASALRNTFNDVY